MKTIKIGKLVIEFGYNYQTNTKLRTNFIWYRKSFKIFNRWYKIDFPIGFNN